MKREVFFVVFDVAIFFLQKLSMDIFGSHLVSTRSRDHLFYLILLDCSRVPRHHGGNLKKGCFKALQDQGVGGSSSGRRMDQNNGSSSALT